MRKIMKLQRAVQTKKTVCDLLLNKEVKLICLGKVCSRCVHWSGLLMYCTQTDTTTTKMHLKTYLKVI